MTHNIDQEGVKMKYQLSSMHMVCMCIVHTGEEGVKMKYQLSSIHMRCVRVLCTQEERGLK